MKKFLSLTTILATTIVLALPANAADLDVIQEPVYTDVEFGSGWYLRGDVGYATSLDSDVSYYADKRYNFKNQDWDDEWSFGGGVGYTWNDYFRTDVTVDYYDNLEWKGNSYGSSCAGMNNSGCKSDTSAEGDLTTVMANAYVHLGQWGGFSPYLQGGLGAAYVDWDSMTSDTTCYTDAVAEACPSGTNSSGTAQSFHHSHKYEGGDDWQFAYSLGAGFEYRLDKNWLVDFGYRYVNVDDGVMVDGGNGLNGDIEFDDLDMHEFRAGIRYEIW